MKKKIYLINNKITAPHLHLIGANGENLGIFSLKEALKLAKDKKLDLVEINSKISPPIIRLINYGKFIYRKEKKMKRKKTKILKNKEIKFRPYINKNDYNIKIKKIIKFLIKGNRTRIILQFQGRENLYKKNSIKILENIKNDISKYGYLEKKIKEENNKIIMIFNSKKK